MEGFRRFYKDDVVHCGEDLSEVEMEAREVPLRYEHLPIALKEKIKRVLLGKQHIDNLPKLASRVVKLFISSTFSDMKLERDVLITDVYPKLKTYCRERHGLDFQAIDMRWGVTDFAKDRQMVTNLCIDEIRNCQRNSIGPNFVAFVGQRHGWKSIPSELFYKNFDRIRQILVDNGKDVSLLDTWYILDTNVKPAEYLLQPISVILGDEAVKWNSIHNEIYGILLEGAKLCVEKGEIEQEFLESLLSSVTELEIREGITKVEKTWDRYSNCICYLRDIKDIHDHLDKDKASKYVDFQPHSYTINTTAYEAAQKTKNELVLPFVREENIFSDTLQWSDPLGVDPVKHKDYLYAMSQHFYRKVRELVDYNVEKQRDVESDPLYEEVLQHWTWAQRRIEGFSGREMEMNAIKDYVLYDTDQAFVVHGPSGNGKTSILAKSATRVNAWTMLQARGVQTTVIVRFCGTSPESSSVRSLLRSLCHQIAFATNRYRHQIPYDYAELKTYFSDLLTKGGIKGLLVIFLDALDQLNKDDDAQKLDWLPAKLSNNIKLIVSTLPTTNSEILKTLQTKITNPENYLEVKTMDPHKAGEIVTHWLSKEQRSLSFDQFRLISDAFNVCASPLFIRLIHQEVRKWHSFTPINNKIAPKSVKECINRLFENLEKENGKILVSRALGYLTASKGGISEAELNDILSIDDLVLNSVFEFWEPPIRRIPPNLWPRIRHDISGYLMERETDETDVLYWYHRQFIEVAEERYLGSPQVRRDIHSVMADYYLGLWSGTTRKPFTYEPGLMKVLGITNSESASCRYVAEQPMVFTTFNTEARYNKRKLNQLPYHLVNANRFHELSKQVYFNYQWIHTKLQACGVADIMADYNLVQFKDVNLVADTLRMAESNLSDDPNMLGLELSGRLLPYYSSYNNVRNLVDQCDAAALKHCPLIPNWQLYVSPGGPLQYVCELGGSCRDGALNVNLIEKGESVFLVTKPFHSPQMRVWDITLGEPKSNMNLPVGCSAFFSPNGDYLHLFKHSGCLHTYSFASTEKYGEVTFPRSGPIMHVATSNKYVAFTVDQENSPFIIDTQASALLDRLQYKAHAVGISQDERYLVCASGCMLAFHELPLLERKCLIKTHEMVHKFLFSKQNTTFYVMYRDKHLCKIDVSLIHRNAKSTDVAHDVEMQDFKLSHGEGYLLVRASRCLFVFDTKQLKMKYRITNMPPGVFVERMSVFKEACFSTNDELLIAARHTYLGIWLAETGEPLRLLLSSVANITNLFTSDIVNKAITMLSDNSVQVWNLDNLEADVQHCHAILKGKVTTLAVSSEGSKVICASSSPAQAKVMDLLTGECSFTLEHSKDLGLSIDEVLVSPGGKFGVTRSENRDNPQYIQPWSVLKEDKLWNLETGELLYTITSNRMVAFGPKDQRIAFFHCRQYSIYDYDYNAYDVIIYDDKQERKTSIMEIPQGDLVGEPFFTCNGDTLMFMLQQTRCEVLEASRAKNRDYFISLCGISMTHRWTGIKFVEIKQLYSGADDNENLLDARPLSDNKILIVYGKGFQYYKRNEDGTYDRSIQIAKGAILYDASRQKMLSRVADFLRPCVDISRLKISHNATVIMDAFFQVSNIATNRMINEMNLQGSPWNESCLLLDGKYLAILSTNQREVKVYRCASGAQVARCLIHGCGTCLKKGPGDRSFVIGCQDGRVMVLTFLIESCDPIKEIVAKIPSRQRPLSKRLTLNRASSISDEQNLLQSVSDDSVTPQSEIDSPVFTTQPSLTSTPRPQRQNSTQFTATSVAELKENLARDVNLAQKTEREIKHVILMRQDVQTRKVKRLDSMGRLVKTPERTVAQSQACSIQ